MQVFLICMQTNLQNICIYVVINSFLHSKKKNWTIASAGFCTTVCMKDSLLVLKSALKDEIDSEPWSAGREPLWVAQCCSAVPSLLYPSISSCPQSPLPLSRCSLPSLCVLRVVCWKILKRRVWLFQKDYWLISRRTWAHATKINRQTDSHVCTHQIQARTDFDVQTDRNAHQHKPSWHKNIKSTATHTHRFNLNHHYTRVPALHF